VSESACGFDATGCVGDAQGKRAEELVWAGSRCNGVARVASMSQHERVELAKAVKIARWARLRLSTREFECAGGGHGSLEESVGGWPAGR
jgi:hypothetical protein